MLRLYDLAVSGNCYKVRLLLAHLGLAYERVEMDLQPGAGRGAEFNTKNPYGRVPCLELDDGRVLSESNAILCYLADGTPYLPADRYDRAQVLQWMFFEQNAHEPFIAAARQWISVLKQPNDPWAQLDVKHARGNLALSVMGGHLRERTFFVGEHFSIADIALYAYTHNCDEGGFELQRYPAVAAWCNRVASQQSHIRLVD